MGNLSCHWQVQANGAKISLSVEISQRIRLIWRLRKEVYRRLTLEQVHESICTGTNRNWLRKTDYLTTVAINDKYDTDRGGDGNYFSVKVRGRVKAFAEGNNRFWVLSDDGVRVSVNGTRYVNRWNDHAPTWDTFTVPGLTKGEYYDI